jgi:O-antigen ligase
MRRAKVHELRKRPSLYRMSLVNAAAKATVEGFLGTYSSEKRRDAYVDFLAVVISFVVALVLLGFVGKYLWNYVIVDLFSFAKPAKSFWQIIGLMIFVSLVRP